MASSTDPSYHHKFGSSFSPALLPPRISVERASHDGTGQNRGHAMENHPTRAANQLRIKPPQVEESILRSSKDLRLPPPLTLNSLSPYSLLDDITLSEVQKAATSNSSAYLHSDEIASIAPIVFTESRDKFTKPESGFFGFAIIDLMSENDQSLHDDALIRDIEKSALVTFLPSPPHKTRVRAFGICNTLENFFAQAHQGKLFARQSSLGRLLEVKISGVEETMGIAEGDNEDFEDFVRDMKRAPVGKPRRLVLRVTVRWKCDCILRE
jgi:hypothetical protein